MLGEDRLRVELHPGERVLTMAQPHHDAVIRPGRNLELRWQAVALDHQRVIAGGGKGARDATKDGLLLVKHGRDLTVHDLLRDKVGLEVEGVTAGPHGGDVQIASRVVEGDVDAVIFLVDPLDKHPHDPDIQTLLRICNVRNVPLATNIATADVLISSPLLQELRPAS